MGNKKVSLDKLIEYFNCMDSINQELATQTDRGLAVLSVTFLDVLLENVLDCFFVLDVNFQKILSGSDNPLGSFNSKILLSHALGLISLGFRLFGFELIFLCCPICEHCASYK